MTEIVWRDWGVSTKKKPTAPVRKDWLSKSLCKGAVGFDSPSNSDLEKLKAICAQCPVRELCLRYATSHNEKGFWAGTTEKDRRVQNGEQRVSPVECHSTSEWLNVPREFDRPTLNLPKKPSLARVQVFLNEVDALFV